MNYDAQPEGLNTRLAKSQRVSGLELMISLGIYDYEYLG
jgi:hypothetical protein